MEGQDNFKVNSAVIKVVGVGGGGGNAINSMIESNVGSARFIAVNTDSQALLRSKADERIQIGERLTKGLGAGSDPSIGEAAAEESKEEISQMLEGTDLLFIAAGMGGGTGTGAAAVIARIAREKGILTVAVVTKPFPFEGRVRNENANIGISNLKKYVDTLVIIPNDKLLQLINDPSVLEAFKIADDMLKQGIIGIVDLIDTSSLINLDFADISTIMRNQGLAHMGIGRAKGEKRVIEAVRQAVSSPLLETTIEGAKSVILNVCGGKDLKLSEVSEAATLVQGIIDDSANIIFGATIDENMSEEIKITVIATGFVSLDEKQARARAESLERQVAFANMVDDNAVPPLLRNIESPEETEEDGGEPVDESEIEQAEIEEEETEEPVEETEESPKRKIPAFMERFLKKK